MKTVMSPAESERLAELATVTAKYANGNGIFETSVEGLRCIKLLAPNMKLPAVYEPSVCVILQGSKQVLLEGEIYHYTPPQFLAISVDLPLLGQVLEASASRPYLCLQFSLNARLIAELIAASGENRFVRKETERGLFVGRLDERTQDALLRLTRLLDSPKDIPILAPMTLREIHYRLLMSEYGPSIAQIAIAGSNTQRVAQVIRKMKTSLAEPLGVEELAALANMSPSSFHQHFKAITAMSPLQYYKRLRLTEARHILFSENTDAATTAYRVGYESTSQFTRDYARMFGAPPIRDVSAMRQVQ